MTDDQVSVLEYIIEHNGRCGKHSCPCTQCLLNRTVECEKAGPYNKPSKELVAAAELLLEQQEIRNE